MPTPLEHWENIVSAHVNGAPLPAMMDAVRTACIHWCRDTRMIREDVTVTTDPARKVIDVPDSAEGLYPSQVIEVFASGRLDDKSYRELDDLYPDGWFDELVTGSEYLKYWVSPTPPTVRLVPRPTVEVDLIIVSAFQPKRNASEVPTMLYELYADEIGAGACAILHSHNSAPYADPAQVAGMQAIFSAAVQANAYKSEAGHGWRNRRTRQERA